jgi:antirestriction protein ArdC
MTPTQTAIAHQALQNATTSNSLTNYQTIYAGFIAKGISADDILPRENVFTFHAWRALGRTVRRGEHGVSVCTWVPMSRRNPDTGETETLGRRPKSTTVFHVSQTEPIS